MLVLIFGYRKKWPLYLIRKIKFKVYLQMIMELRFRRLQVLKKHVRVSLSLFLQDFSLGQNHFVAETNEETRRYCFLLPFLLFCLKLNLLSLREYFIFGIHLFKF